MTLFDIVAGYGYIYAMTCLIVEYKHLSIISLPTQVPDALTRPKKLRVRVEFRGLGNAFNKWEFIMSSNNERLMTCNALLDSTGI